MRRGRRRRLSIPLAVAFGLLAPPQAQVQAAPGDLDPTFGGNGKVTTGFTAGFDYVTGLAVQPDGRIVAAGWGGGKFALARYEPDGTLDDTFGGDGKVLTDFTGRVDWANDVAIQPDGRIVAVGTAGFQRFAAARYLPDGTLDDTFGEDGKVTTTFVGADSEEEAEGVAIQDDGKIVVAGFAEVNRMRFAVLRYRPGGRLDPSFGGDGRVKTGFGQTGGDMANAVAVQPDGRVVVAGTAGFGRFAIARYAPDGTRDPAFGGDGRVTTRFLGGIQVANDLALQPDGKIVAAGETASPYYTISRPGDAGAGGNGAFALARYRPGGRLDPSFGSDGKVTTNFSRRLDAARSVAIQPDGRIVAAGVAREWEGDFDSSFALVRYELDGTRDETFGDEGKLTTDFSDSFDAALAVAVQPDGKIVAGGRTPRGEARFALARYLAA